MTNLAIAGAALLQFAAETAFAAEGLAAYKPQQAVCLMLTPSPEGQPRRDGQR